MTVESNSQDVGVLDKKAKLKESMRLAMLKNKAKKELAEQLKVSDPEVRLNPENDDELPEIFKPNRKSIDITDMSKFYDQICQEDGWDEMVRQELGEKALKRKKQTSPRKEQFLIFDLFLQFFHGFQFIFESFFQFLCFSEQ